MSLESFSLYRGDRVSSWSRGYGTVRANSRFDCQTVYVAFDNDSLGPISVYKANLTRTNTPEPRPTYLSYMQGERVKHTQTGGKGTVYQDSDSTWSWLNIVWDSSDTRFPTSVVKSYISRVTDSVPTTTTTTSKDENMTQNNLPQVGDIVTFKPGFDHAGETAKVIAVNPNARKYPVQVEYAPETQHRSLKSIVEPERKFDFKVGDRIEAALGDSIIRGEVTYAAPSIIDVKLDGTRSVLPIRAKSDFEVTKLIELPTKQFAQIRVNGTVLVLIGGKFVNPITNRTRTPRRVTEQVVNEGRDYEVLFDGLDA